MLPRNSSPNIALAIPQGPSGKRNSLTVGQHLHLNELAVANQLQKLVQQHHGSQGHTHVGNAANIIPVGTNNAPPPADNRQRVTWMASTSDVIGSHVRTDLDSCLELVRRKVQSKASTTQELITHIRRNRSGETGFVTPNEFRFVLIKLGVILPPGMADQVFNTFDTDRSGSINFDEFATWVMNSEFKPIQRGGKHINELTYEDTLRNKFNNWYKKHPDLAAMLGSKMVFSAFKDVVNKKFLRFTEPDLKEIFRIIDTQHTGFIDGSDVLNWATKSNLVVNRESELSPIKSIDNNFINDATTLTSVENSMPTTVENAIIDICGKDVQRMEWAFMPLVSRIGNKEVPIMVKFDEFHRNLLDEGIGREKGKIRNLFHLLKYGKTIDVVNIKKLLDILPGLIETVTEQIVRDDEMKAKSHSTLFEDFNSNHIPTRSFHNHMETESSRIAKVDRVIREMMRHCYEPIKREFEISDPKATGFVDIAVFQRIVNKFCLQLTEFDFNIILKQVWNLFIEKKLCIRYDIVQIFCFTPASMNTF